MIRKSEMRKHIFILIALFLAACTTDKKPKLVQLQGFVFGTTYSIIYVDNFYINYQKSIDSLFHLVNKSLSTYMPTSDISKINKGDTSVAVDELFEEVFLKSKRIKEATDGYFDPTVGNLVNAWGFGPDGEKIEMDSVKVQKMMQFVGLDKVELRNKKIQKQYPEIYLDFNSIAKGFGADVVGRYLEQHEVKNYLVEIGGEIRARGTNGKNKPWKIGIEKPNSDGTQSIQRNVTLTNASMATSGNYRKFRITKKGKKYVHTVNPKTGFASESNLLSATVIATADCADVDAYATGLMAMGLEKAHQFIAKNKQLRVILMFLNSEGNIEEFDTDSQ